MKYIYSFLAVLILCCCSAHKKGTQPRSGHDGDTLLILSETASENDVNPNLYTFEFVNGTYWDMNDLTYFLADTSIKSLRLYDGTFSDLRPLAELTGLEELEISSNRYITDISPIGSLVNLKKLTLFNETYKGSIEAISSLVNMEELFLVYRSRYYRELLPLQKLEKLILSSYGVDFTYIAQLYSLKKLSIHGGGAANIEQLKNLVNLEEFFIDCVDNFDISWITHLKKLKDVGFLECTINDISPLLELPNLVSVDLWSSTVNDITPLLESTSIKSISGLIVENHVPTRIPLIRTFEERGIEFTFYYSDR
jgi:Leucine-rich repeat (LRR) protein